MSPREKNYPIFGEMVTVGIHGLAIGKRIGAVQNDLAEELGVAPVTIHSWRQGLHRPEPETIKKLARIFVERSRVDQVWLEQFLHQAGYDQTEGRQIVGELLENASLPPAQETTPTEGSAESAQATGDESARYAAFGDRLTEGINRLALVRKQKLGETEAQLADDLGYSVSMLRGYWRSGKSLPTAPEIIAKLAQLFVDEGDFAEAWTRQFLIAGQYDSPEIVDRFIEELFSVAGKRTRANRATLIAQVETFWLEGVLKRSLLQANDHFAVPLKTQPQAVISRPQYELRRVVRLRDEPEEMLPDDVTIGEVFEKMDRALLVLGAPASGKTTQLLKLAQGLLAQAKKDRRQPIPVVFNLSSWSRAAPSLEAWLLDELFRFYNIPVQVGQSWLEQNQLLLLLDGLDEVLSEQRAACVEAINLLMRTHPMPIAICSRLADYEILTTRLQLSGAVCLQPLTPERVVVYLDQCGPEVAAVRHMHHQDATWRELAQSPLMLNVMIEAFKGEALEAGGSFGSIETGRAYLFEAYITRVFRRVVRFENGAYDETQTRRWLTRLARKMQRDHQSIFLIERIQPDWLDSPVQRRLYRLLTWFIVIQLLALPFELFFGPFFALVYFFTLAQVSLQEIGKLAIWFVGGVFAGQGVGLLATLLLEKWMGAEIKSVETLTWSYSAFRKRFPTRGLIGLGVGSVLGLPIIILGLVVDDLFGGVIYGGYAWGVIGLSLALLLAIIGGFDTDLELKGKQKPNQGMGQSVLNVLLVGGSSALATILATLLALALTLILMTILLLIELAALGGDLSSPGAGFILVIVIFLALATLVFGIVSGLFTSLIAALRFGGLALLRHNALRLVLFVFARLPWNIAAFLDSAVDRILLYKVGGGYMFIHRMLLEHFAKTTPED